MVEFFRRINPKFRGFLSVFQRFFIGFAVRHSTRQFGNFADKYLILGVPVDDDFVFKHPILQIASIDIFSMSYRLNHNNMVIIVNAIDDSINSNPYSISFLRVIKLQRSPFNGCP